MAHEDTAREILDLHITDTPNGYVVDYYEAIGAITSALQAAAAEARERALCQANAVQTGHGSSPEGALQSDGSAEARVVERLTEWFSDADNGVFELDDYRAIMIQVGLMDFEYNLQRPIEEERSDDTATAPIQDAGLTPNSAIRSKDHG